MIRLANAPSDEMAVGLAALAALLVVVFYLPARRRVTNGRRTALTGLRLAWTLLALAVFLRPVVDEFLPPVKRVMAVLLDASASMSVRAGPEPRPDGKTRYESARAAVSVIERQMKHGWEIRTMTFGESVSLSIPGHPTHRVTNLADAIDAGRQSAGPGGAVVLLTDGVTTAGGDPIRAAARAASSAIPIVSLYPQAGRVSERRILGVEYDPVIEKARKSEIQVTVAGAGSMTVTLIDKGKPIAESRVDGNSSDAATTVRIPHVPDELGMKNIQVALSASAGEIVLADNVCTITQKVVNRRVATIAVVWTVEHPRWDVRGIVTSIEDVRGVDARSLAGSLTSWRDAAGPLGLGDRVAADALIFVGVPAAAVGLDVQEKLVRAIDLGMGFAMLGGPEGFGRGGWAGTALSKVLPVEFGDNEVLMSDAVYNPRVTRLGRKDPVTRILDDGTLPPLKAVNVVGRAKPVASVLAVHPTLSAAGAPIPLIAKGRYGNGRTIAIPMADVWRWVYRHEKGRDAMKTFWRRVAAYLAPVDPSRVEIDVPGVWASAGVEVESRVRVADGSGEVVWEANGAGIHDSGTLPPAGGRIRVRPVSDGDLVFAVKAPPSIGGPEEEMRVTVNVSSSALEGKTFGPDTGVLGSIAGLTANLMAPFDKATEVLSSLAESPVPAYGRRRTEEIWDRPWILVVFILLLALEWGFRRYWGLP